MTRSSNQFLLSILMLIWLLGITNWMLDYQLNYYGLFPRNISRLAGILATPFLHGDFVHLANNSIAFLFLGWLVSLYKNQIVKLSIFIVLVGGFLVWLFGRPFFHVGLSALIFGYWGFITFNALFEKSIKSILISAVAIFFYGGMIFGVLPSSPLISFESHLFGAISGVLYSYVYRRKPLIKKR